MILKVNKRWLTQTRPCQNSVGVNPNNTRSNYGVGRNNFGSKSNDRSARRLNYNKTVKFNTNTNFKKLEHETNFKFKFRQFLGNRNYKKLYKQNPFAKDVNFPSTSSRNTITPSMLSAMLTPGLHGSNVDGNGNTNYITGDPLRPFPQNEFCKTNKIIPYDLKAKIYNDFKVKKISPQLISQSYNIKLVRVLAIIKLYELELNKDGKLIKLLQEQNGKLNKNVINLLNYNSMMYNYFPHFQISTNTMKDSENLTELPNPLNKSIFVTLNESEPFGPLDSANLLQRQPAKEILDNLTKEEKVSTEDTTHRTQIIYSKLYERDRFQYKFINERVRPTDENTFIHGISNNYGAKKYDNSKYKKLFVDEQGKLQYV